MRLCVGTAKGIIILDPERGGAPCMISADPPSVWCIAQDSIDPHLLYAGSVHNSHAGSARGRGSLAVSEDGGREWRDITYGPIRDEEVWSLAAAPDRSGEVFIGTSHARLFRSENRGRTLRECAAFARIPGRDRWSLAQAPHIPRVRALCFDHAKPPVLYAGVEGGGVFRSHDRGESFEPLSPRIPADIHCLTPGFSESSRLFAATGEGLFFAHGRGHSWTQASGLSRAYVVPVLPRPNGTVYTAAAAGPPATWSIDQIGAGALLFRSTDRGASFQPIAAADGETRPTRGMLMRLVAAPAAPHLIFGAVSDGAIIRIDERENLLSIVAEKLPPCYDLAVLP